MAEAMRDLITQIAVEQVGAAAPSLNCANLQDWDTRINHTVTTLGTWWNSLVDVPSSQQLDELKVLLLPADADEGIGTANDKNPHLNGHRTPHEGSNNSKLSSTPVGACHTSTTRDDAATKLPWCIGVDDGCNTVITYLNRESSDRKQVDRSKAKKLLRAHPTS